MSVKVVLNPLASPLTFDRVRFGSSAQAEIGTAEAKQRECAWGRFEWISATGINAV